MSKRDDERDYAAFVKQMLEDARKSEELARQAYFNGVSSAAWIKDPDWDFGDPADDLGCGA